MVLIPPPAGAALPIVKTLTDCADFSSTVSPYLPQSKALPSAILSHITDLEGLKGLYISTNPVISALAFSLAITPIFLIVSEINKNYSQVDRVWSILPTIYNAHYAIWARMNGSPSNKLDNVLAFSAVWSSRSTYNYWRKGGYTVGSEDYRWETVRKYVTPFQMFLFNVVFISLAQSFLLFSITTPTYVSLLTSRSNGDKMEIADLVFSRILVGLVLLEFFADNAQWKYYNARTHYRETAKVPLGWDQASLERGFNTHGLFAYSRHPNFAAEQTIWCMSYQWCCYETFTFVNWTFVGAMGYLLLFQSSTWFTELITSKKYPEYKVYQERVGKFLPKSTGPGWDEYELQQERVKARESAKSK